MTLSTTTSRVAHAADGVSTTFAFAFKIWAASNLKVYLRNTTTLVDTLQALGANYAVDIVTYPATGNVVFTSAPAAGQTVVIVRDMPLTQELDLIASGAFAAENVEAQLDKLVAEIQTLRELIARSPRFGVGTTVSDLPLPEPQSAVANQLLGVTAAGDGFEYKVPANLSLQTVSSYIGTLLDDADAATARATLGIGAPDLNLLTTDNTGGAHTDFLAFVDASESNASNKVRVDNFFSIAITSSSDTTPADPNNFEVMARRLSDGTLHRMLLSEFGLGKQTIWIPAGAMTARTSNGPASGTVETATNKVMINTLDFDAAADEFAQFTVQMPKRWNEGTVSALFVWSHAAAATNFGVVWGIQGLALSDDDALDAAFGTAQTVTDTGGTTNDLYRSPETAALTIGGAPAENDVVVFQVYRDADHASDTLAIDARLHGVALFYTTSANVDN
jgi:hypothetical protein